MLLTLLPPTSAPALHHPLVLPEPHHARAPLPVGWAAQLSGLQQDGLDMPPSIHALDGSSGWSAIVEECVFELFDAGEGVRVECILVGGGSVVWDVGRSCAEVLREALTDLAAAKKEAEKERAAIIPRTSAPIHHTYPGAGRAEWAQSSDTLALPPPVVGKGAKHKKQRSLLFLSSIVSGLHKLAASASSSPTRTAFPTSPTREDFMNSPSPTQVAFGGARSTAWTTTLAFLPPARKTPLPVSVARPRSAILHAKARGGSWTHGDDDEPEGALCTYDYPRWTAARMLRRTEEWMAWLVQEARENGGGSLDMDTAGGSRRTSAALSVTIPGRQPERSASELSGKTLVPGDEESAGREVSVEVGEVMYNDEGEREVDEWEESVSTEASSCTEDSESVHTPVDGEEGMPFALPLRSSSSSSSSSHSRADSLVDAHPHAADVPRSPTPPSSQATYAALSAQRIHLLKLLRSMNTHRVAAAQDARSARAVLEVKSRRRAWSSRAYLGRAEGRLCGLATPVRSSPLARCEPTTAAWGEPAGALEVCTGESDLKELFPVEEVDEDEEVEDLQSISLADVAGTGDEDALEDLESGLLPPMPVPSPFGVSTPTRVRTQSMYVTNHPNAPAPYPPRESSLAKPANLNVDVHPYPERSLPSLPLPSPLSLPPTPSPSHAQLPGRPPSARHKSVTNPVNRPPLPASALLFQPLKPKFESQTKFALVDDCVDGHEDAGPPYIKVSVEMEVGVNVREGWGEGVGVR
ncbi:uncharacterized protein B0H18DRAFT_960949 [Fomitopsis serialis]|uniref:uncharacterized protein n=1 Tax=Fomitopsis serialis TaxID=139415 RepID=UPI002008911E|nr:uncharacterized protein B0H18DRAFT_960949 [Neoantrodia serialis]KAH9912579.1 hypothetical protein B0H18DRAFT_960949 [Neoantrodia serialis]